MFKGNSKPQEKKLGLYSAPCRRYQLSNFEKKRTVFGIISLQEHVTHIPELGTGSWEFYQKTYLEPGMIQYGYTDWHDTVWLYRLA